MHNHIFSFKQFQINQVKKNFVVDKTAILAAFLAISLVKTSSLIIYYHFTLLYILESNSKFEYDIFEKILFYFRIRISNSMVLLTLKIFLIIR